jgi:hypothetical protein
MAGLAQWREAVKTRILFGALALLVSTADAARAIPEDALVTDIAVRPDGTTVYLFGLTLDGSPRIGFATRSDPADPATESPVRLVPLSVVGTPTQENHPAALSPDGRFLTGDLRDFSLVGFPVRGLLFDTLQDGATPVVFSGEQVPLFPETSPALPVLAQLGQISNAGTAIGVTGVIPPFGPILRGFRATSDGVAVPLEPFPAITFDGEETTFHLITPADISESGAVVGTLNVIGNRSGATSEPILLEPNGTLLQLQRPPRTGMDFVFPFVLASDGTRGRGRILAGASLETRGSGIAVYDNALSAPRFYLLGPDPVFIRGAALDASSFLGLFGDSDRDPAAALLLREAGPAAAAACEEGSVVGMFRGRPLRRVEGASVFASGPAGFRFCIAGDRAGEVLIAHDLLRELVAIEGSGFDETSRIDLCAIGDNGAQASIVCQGTDASFERVIRFSDRARLVRAAPAIQGLDALIATLAALIRLLAALGVGS